MIIISQDKTKLVNFNNVIGVKCIPVKPLSSVNVRTPWPHTSYIELYNQMADTDANDAVSNEIEEEQYCIVVSSDAQEYIMGYYPTNERGIKVLEAIVNAAGLNMYKYQMPKK